MVQRGQKVGFTQTSFPNHNNWATLIRSNRLNAFQKIVSWICNTEKLLGRNLRRAGIGVV